MIDRYKTEPSVDYNLVTSPILDIKLEDALLAESQHSHLHQPLPHESQESTVCLSFIEKQTTEVNFPFFLII